MSALMRALGVVLVTATVTFMAQAAQGADCGDGVGPCRCGDRVVTTTTLDGSDPVLSTTCPCVGLIVASNVALDIAGTIRGSGSGDPVCYGIHIEDDATNVRITHGRVTGFFMGVFGAGGGSAEGVTHVTIAGIQALGNAESGIHLEGRDVVVEHNVVRGNGFVGIDLFADSVVRWNKAEANAHGIFVLGDTVLVANNVAVRNRLRGIEVGTLFGGGTVTVRENRADLNGGLGFGLFGDHVHAVRNIATRNGRDESGDQARDGFLLECGFCRLERNRSFYNGGFGILEAAAPDPNVYTDNLCGGNALGDSDPPGLCR
jgi:hypothetical protein